MCKAIKYDITVKPCRFGHGLFATSNIPQGAMILDITGKRIQFHDASELGDFECYPIQITLKEYIAPTKDTIWQFINHSCDPNCGINGKLQIIALKEINGGDELYFDYSTSMLERHWTMKCECGTSICRNIVSDFDSLPEMTQRKYIQLDIVQPFILDKLNE